MPDPFAEVRAAVTRFRLFDAAGRERSFWVDRDSDRQVVAQLRLVGLPFFPVEETARWFDFDTGRPYATFLFGLKPRSSGDHAPKEESGATCRATTLPSSAASPA